MPKENMQAYAVTHSNINLYDPADENGPCIASSQGAQRIRVGDHRLIFLLHLQEIKNNFPGVRRFRDPEREDARGARASKRPRADFRRRTPSLLIVEDVVRQIDRTSDGADA